MSGKSRKDYWVGFDLGGTKMLATVYDGKFKQIGRERKKTKGHEGAEAGLERMVAAVQDALAKAGVEPSALSGIGIGCPGPLDLDAGVILETPNLGWTNVRVKKTFEKALGCPAFILNDVDAGVFGEFMFGAARGARCAIGLFPGTGIGGGCVYEGKLLRGRTTSCMEIGHIPMSPSASLGYGDKGGTLELIASRLSISSAAAAAAYRGEAPHLMEQAGTDLSNIRSGALAAAIAAGDESIRAIVTDAARWVGKGVATAVHMLAPDVIVLGGGLVQAMPELYKHEVESSARAYVMPALRDVFKVKVAELGDDASVMGAAAWAKTMVEA